MSGLEFTDAETAIYGGPHATSLFYPYGTGEYGPSGHPICHSRNQEIKIDLDNVGMGHFTNHYSILKSNSKKVKEFTEARLRRKVRDTPVPLSKESVKKYIGLVMSELSELARTVTETNDEAYELVRNSIKVDPMKKEPSFESSVDILAAQADAMVDLEYYSQDIACEHGINLDMVFQEVHDANMRKKFDDGTFHTEEIVNLPGNYKVIKPPGWKGPNIEKVLERMAINGSW